MNQTIESTEIQKLLHHFVSNEHSFYPQAAHIIYVDL